MSRLAVFIDGGYLDRVLRDSFGSPKISYRLLVDRIAQEIGQDVETFRSYYYHCLPHQSSSPTEKEARRFGAAQNFFEALRRLPRFEVREGKLARYGPDANGKYHYQQKRVDVLLSVDLVQLSSKHIIEHAALVAGDSDFLPAVKVARNEGVSVWLFHGNKYHQELWTTADERIPITQEIIDSVLYSE